MLNFAIRNWPEHTILIKTHPDVIHGRKLGHFNYSELNKERVKVCDDGGHPTKLLEESDANQWQYQMQRKFNSQRKG